MLKIAALVSGGGSNLQAIIDAIGAGCIKNAEIALVVSTNHHAYALERAKNHGIATAVFAKKDYTTPAAREDALINLLKVHGVGLLALCGSLMVFSEKFITDFAKPIINVHPALLPNFGGKGFYGLRVHEAVLAAGVATTGATVHYVDGGIDTGSIILQKEVAVLPGDTPETLQRRVMEEAEWQILPEVIKMFADG
ncbi:MAG: phosphoribosylglycinamide formyltransferase, partial [Defluviitaleaceae bacterium]|nr:phosphoribosylglycinamide formyltransferase [Defluviitaleaceae bacterium]